MRLRLRMQKSTPTSDKSLESAVSVEGRRLPVRRESKKRMNAAHGCFRWIVKLCVVVTALLQLLHALRCTRAQIIESAEHDRFGWTNLCAGRNESALLPIVTKCALECAACVWQRRRPAIDQAKRT